MPDEDQPKSAQQSKRDGKTPNTERLQVHHTNSYSFITLGPDGKSYLCGKGEMTRRQGGGKPNASDRVRDHCHVTGAFEAQLTAAAT